MNNFFTIHKDLFETKTMKRTKWYLEKDLDFEKDFKKLKDRWIKIRREKEELIFKQINLSADHMDKSEEEKEIIKKRKFPKQLLMWLVN